MPFTGIAVPGLPAVGLRAAVPGPLHPGLQAGLMGAPSMCCAPPSVPNLCPGCGLWCPGTLQNCRHCAWSLCVSFGETAQRAKCEEDSLTLKTCIAASNSITS